METVSTYENDVLKSQTVNGVPQAVTNQGKDVIGREKTGKDVDATNGNETVAGQGAHGGEGGAEEMEKYKNVQTIEELGKLVRHTFGFPISGRHSTSHYFCTTSALLLHYSCTGLQESLQPCSRAARKWRENEEMKKKWRENEEIERKWRENEKMERE